MLAVWGLVTFGLTTIITQSKVFEPLRRLFRKHTTFLDCPMCVGFWSGAGLAFCEFTPTDSTWWGIFLAGCASSAVCWIGHVILVKLGAESL